MKEQIKKALFDANKACAEVHYAREAIALPADRGNALLAADQNGVTHK